VVRWNYLDTMFGGPGFPPVSHPGLTGGIGAGPSGFRSTSFNPPTGGGVSPIQPGATFAGNEEHVQGGRIDVHATLLVSPDPRQVPYGGVGHDFGAALPAFTATLDNRNTEMVPKNHVRMKSVLALNYYLRTEAGRNKFRDALACMADNGVMRQWSWFGIQQSNINEVSRPGRKVFDVNMQVMQRAWVPNFWHPKIIRDVENMYEEKYIMPGYRVWLLCVCRIYHQKGPAQERRGARKRNSRDHLKLRATDIPSYDRGDLADGTEDPDSRYWCLEPWATIGSDKPPSHLYNKGKCYGKAIFIGQVTDLYGNHTDPSPNTRTLTDAALFGMVPLPIGQELVDNAPRLEIMMGIL